MRPCPREFLLLCACLYLFSAAGAADGPRGSLRSAAAAAVLVDAETDTASAESATVGSESEGGSSGGGGGTDGIPAAVTEPSPSDALDEEFDYESYHAKHRIPVPALGATMMGLVSPEAERKGNAEEAIATATDAKVPPQIKPGGILSFAGTSAALQNYASQTDSEQKGDATNARLSLEETDKEDSPPANNMMMYEATLASISKSRSSLLWGSDDAGLVESDADSSSKESERQSGEGPSLDDASTDNRVEAPSIPQHRTSMPRSDADLDRGRHLVGLEVREVRPHQQIIVDYADNTEEEGEMKSLRIRYFMSENAEKTEASDGANELLKTLMATSFNATAAFWSRALSLPPVMGNIVPTVSTCGGASIPQRHRQTGVDNADTIIYVSADNAFCGGALLHSAICDYDQNMRPLVANVNICADNIPTMTTDDGARMTNSTVDEYASYIATETARVLGADLSLLRHYRNPDTYTPFGTTEKRADCVDGSQETIAVPNVLGEEVDSTSGEVYYELRTPKVTEVVRNHFDCMTLTGARLERRKGSAGCFGGYLDERLFFGEQLTAFQSTGPLRHTLAISPLTLALLEDSSWYVADYGAATEVPFGRGAGCPFAHGGCAIDDEGAVPDASKHGGVHCPEIGLMGCDVSHTSKARCDILHPSPNKDVCPMHVRGAIGCADGSASLSASPGEVYGESSRCFVTDQGVPMCLKGVCNEETQSIDVYYQDEKFSCRRDGQIIDTQQGRIVCPMVAAACPNLACPSECSGRGVCDEDGEGKHVCICDDPFDETPGCWGR